MKVRTLSAVVMAVIALTAIGLGGYVLDAVVLFCSFAAMHEFFSVFRKKGLHPISGVGILFWLMLAVLPFAEERGPGLIRFSRLGSLNLFDLFVTVSLLCLLAVMVFRFEKHSAVDGAVTLFGMFYTVYLFSYFILLREMEGGFYMLLLAVLGCVGADTAAYLIGSRFGKRKLAPHVSPNKTVIGGVGGLLGGALGALCLFFAYYGLLQPAPFSEKWINLIFFLGLGVGTAAFAELGDLAESAIKRKLGIKDMGKILPGHGGVLDRIDSALYACLIVCFVFVIRIMTTG